MLAGIELIIKFKYYIMLTPKMGSTVENIQNRKRSIEWTDIQDNEDESRKSGKSMEKTNNGEMSVRISFYDQNLDFLKVDWSTCCKFINTITNYWEFLAFSSDHRNVLISTNSNDDNKKIMEMKELIIKEESLKVKVEQLKIGTKKGIIFNKTLTMIEEGDLKESLNSQGIKNYFRIQRNNQENTAKFYTGSIILDFEEEVSQHIIISKISIPVNQMVPKLMLCYHCGILGHTRARCSKINIEFCKKCFSQHEQDTM